MFEGRISSGKKGRETPEGEYVILQKKRLHWSNLWPKPKGGAKMPYMMRLTNDGIAMHLGYVPNRAASHGCIRLKNGFAQEMFAWAKVGTKVFVEGDASEYGKKPSYGYDDDYVIIDFHD
jgi:lipoprotein-anchoring transpeptidase ErfK/SrfK